MDGNCVGHVNPIVQTGLITVQSAGHVHSVVIIIAILLWIVLVLPMQGTFILFLFGWQLVSAPGTVLKDTKIHIKHHLGSLYVNIINIDFLVRLAAKTSIKSLISFFVPLVAWALGIVDEDFYDATLSMISLFVLAISIFYLKVCDLKWPVLTIFEGAYRCCERWKNKTWDWYQWGNELSEAIDPKSRRDFWRKLETGLDISVYTFETSRRWYSLHSKSVISYES